MRITINELDVFQRSGPTYLVDSGETWTHANSLRAAMACLVQAVYALDKDRRLSKMQLPPLAPGWHLPFKYKLVKTVQEAEGSEQIVGAVFKWSRRLSLLQAGAAPKIVIAFRGTIPFGDTRRSDLRADLDVIMLQLHKTPRFLVGLREVEQAVARYGAGKVCVTGHSLGAAVCLLVGRTLARRNCFVDAHLFSPPFPSLKTIAAALVANFVHDNANQDTSSLDRDSHGKKASTNWRPNLYVNKRDPICAAYVAYFREVERNGGSQGMRRGIRSRMQSWAGREAIPFHLVPCARLYFTEAGRGFKKVHGMKQWWSQEIAAHIQSRFAGLAAST